MHTNGSVYILDDDADILMMCRLVLEQKGFSVYSDTSCMQVVDKIRLRRPEVILMDNKIAPEGGIVATRALKSQPDIAGIPVIFFSANINVEALSKEAGADFFIQKPFDISQLEEIVSMAVRHYRANSLNN